MRVFKTFITTLCVAILFICVITTASLVAQNYYEIEPFDTFAAAYNDYVNLVPVNKKLREDKLKDLLHKWRKLEKSQGWKGECNE